MSHEAEHLLMCLLIIWIFSRTLIQAFLPRSPMSSLLNCLPRSYWFTRPICTAPQTQNHSSWAMFLLELVTGFQTKDILNHIKLIWFELILWFSNCFCNWVLYPHAWALTVYPSLILTLRERGMAHVGFLLGSLWGLEMEVRCLRSSVLQAAVIQWKTNNNYYFPIKR